MHDKFQIAGFQNKRDIHHRSLSFICLFLLGHLPVSWLQQNSGHCERIQIFQLKFQIKYLCLIKLSVFVVCGSFIFLPLQAIIEIEWVVFYLGQS